VHAGNATRGAGTRAQARHTGMAALEAAGSTQAGIVLLDFTLPDTDIDTDTDADADADAGPVPLPC
jgi:DNA-binding response OmpR family regulator